MARTPSSSKSTPVRSKSDWVHRAKSTLEQLEPVLQPKGEEPPLIAWLTQAVAERGVTLQKLAEDLGVTYGYLAQLRSGLRSVTNISDPFLDRVAQWLNVPRISVLAACGRLRLSDFSDLHNLDEALDAAYAFIQRDRVWGAVMPPSAHRLDQPGRLFVVRLFEAATGTVLIPEPKLVPRRQRPAARGKREA